MWVSSIAKYTVISPNFLEWKFAERHKSRIVSGILSETMRKLCLSAKFLNQAIRWNCGIVNSSGYAFDHHENLNKFLKLIYFRPKPSTKSWNYMASIYVMLTYEKNDHLQNYVLFHLTIHKKWSFKLRISSVEEILNGKLHFLRETNLLFLSLLNLPKFFKKRVSSNFNTLLLKTYTS